jgi:hypothetical protein
LLVYQPTAAHGLTSFKHQQLLVVRCWCQHVSCKAECGAVQLQQQTANKIMLSWCSLAEKVEQFEPCGAAAYAVLQPVYD